MYILIPFHSACETNSSVFIVLKSFNLMLNEDGSQAFETTYLGVTTQSMKCLNLLLKLKCLSPLQFTDLIKMYFRRILKSDTKQTTIKSLGSSVCLAQRLGP